MFKIGQKVLFVECGDIKYIPRKGIIKKIKSTQSIAKETKKSKTLPNDKCKKKKDITLYVVDEIKTESFTKKETTEEIEIFEYCIWESVEEFIKCTKKDMKKVFGVWLNEVNL